MHKKQAIFEPTGGKAYALTNGASYNLLSNGSYDISVSDVNSAYEEFNDPEKVSLDYVIMGPGLNTESDTLQKASYVGAVAANRKGVSLLFHHTSLQFCLPLELLVQTKKDIVNSIKNFYSTIGSNSYLVFGFKL